MEPLTSLIPVSWQSAFSTQLQMSELTAIVLTLGSFQLGLWFYQKSKRFILLHPVIIGGICIAAFLNYYSISYDHYKESSRLFYFLLGPATVALAIPLFQEFHHIRKLSKTVLITVIAGGTAAVVSAIGIAYILGADDTILRSLAAKSVTTPIALGISEKIGGLATLTTGVVVFTGIFGAIMSPLVFRLSGLADPRLQGIVLGINAHGIGTALAFERNASSGAFASLAMGLTGTFTALTVPYAISLLSYL